ncbi:hypothetical protein BV908_17040 [Diaphorobacter sp. LR2014-1]|nr:hypothetical protein BV908_17040 [Diaphorobacter sp. LR2014-1]
MRPKWAGGPANRPDGPLQSLRRRVWAARVFALSVPDAFEKHFFNGLLRHVPTQAWTIGPCPHPCCIAGFPFSPGPARHPRCCRASSGPA